MSIEPGTSAAPPEPAVSSSTCVEEKGTRSIPATSASDSKDPKMSTLERGGGTAPSWETTEDLERGKMEKNGKGWKTPCHLFPHLRLGLKDSHFLGLLRESGMSQYHGSL